MAPDQESPPTEIAESERAYHLFVLERRRETAAASAKAAAAMESWWHYLQRRYHLNDADSVDEHGVITRVERVCDEPF